MLKQKKIYLTCVSDSTPFGISGFRFDEDILSFHFPLTSEFLLSKEEKPKIIPENQVKQRDLGKFPRIFGYFSWYFHFRLCALLLQSFTFYLPKYLPAPVLLARFHSKNTL